jgi:hypothetical protein
LFKYRIILTLKTFRYLIIILLLHLFCCLQNIEAQDTTFVKTSLKKKDTPEPQKAAMLSAVFPGMGQVYNRKFWKLPLVYAGFAGLGFGVVYNTTRYNKYIKAYQDFTDKIPETTSYVEFAPSGWASEIYDPVLHPDTYRPTYESDLKGLLIRGVDNFRKDRDLSFIGIAAWYILSILDANVDASLSDYNVDKNLNLTVTPLPD